MVMFGFIPLIRKFLKWKTFFSCIFHILGCTSNISLPQQKPSGCQVDSSPLACGSSLSVQHDSRAGTPRVAGRCHCLLASYPGQCVNLRVKMLRREKWKSSTLWEKMTNYWFDQFILVAPISERVWCSRDDFYYCLANPTWVYALRKVLFRVFPYVLQVWFFSSVLCL